MTGKGFLDKFLRGGLVNAFGQTGGLTGLGPKVSYDATKGFVGSNDLVGGYAGDIFGQQGKSLAETYSPSERGSAGQELLKDGLLRNAARVSVGDIGDFGKGVVRRDNPFAGGLLGNFLK